MIPRRSCSTISPAIDAWEDVGGIPKRFSGTISTDTADIRRKDQKRIGDRKLSCRYAVLYDRDGAGLRIYVEAEDPQFLPAGERGAMYRGDSIQIYIDQKNDTPATRVLVTTTTMRFFSSVF
ncbi:MAG: hypothetical protein L6W00_16755 [Lentisphaeria bacterium]|nr:MAG: hypothetical protein L6W00_16755 [Lentisphaeria bacterium]